MLLRIGGLDDEVIAPEADDEQVTTVGPAATAVHDIPNADTAATIAGSSASAIDAAEVRAAAEAAGPQAQPLTARDPRAARRGPKQLRRARTLAAITATTLTVAIIALGGWAATRVTYFIGTSQGFVSIYQGVPYDLPFGLSLYRSVYQSGVPISSLSAAQRARLLDHQVRSGKDARDLIKAVEREELR